MATRSAKLYQGEDFAPVIDYTDLVIWEESEFGTRAWLGEGNGSTVVIRDPLGEQGSALSLPAGLTMKSLASKNLFVIQLDTDFMFRGRVGIKNYSRDDQYVERYRQVECQLHDTNWDLDHIFVHNYPRPAENDIQRAQGVIASYLSGSPRETTVLNGSNFLSGSNTVSLPANTYTQTSPLGILREVAATANKQFFVTGDSLTGGSLFWDGNDSTVYQAGIRISDRLDEMNTTGGCSSSSSTATVLDARTGSTGGVNIYVPAGLSNSALVIAIQLDDTVTPPPVTWGGQNATLIDSAHNGSQGLAFYYLLDPTPGDPTVVAGGTTNPAVWLLENVDQSNPVASVTFNTGTGTVTSVTGSGGQLMLDAGSVFDGDFVNDPSGWFITASGGQIADATTFIQLPTPGYVDTYMGIGHGDLTPGWTFDASHPWYAGILAINAAPLGAGDLTFPPIWNVGPASTEDGAEQLCEVRLFWGSGTDSYVTAHNLTVHTQYGHSSETITDDTIATVAEAQTKANAILAHRQYEDKTYNVTVGPLTDEQVLCVKHGQIIQIKARAIPDADDAFRSMRIAQCRYTTPIVGIWFAHLQLGRPWKMQPYSKGPPLTPTSAGSGDTAEPLGLTGDPGTDTGTFANPDHIHAHGTLGTNDLHTEYVREAILTARGDIPYATGASVWNRLGIGASNPHLISDGVDPLWRPQPATGSGSALTVEESDGSPSVASVDKIKFDGLTVTDQGSGDVLVSLSAGGGGSASEEWWHHDNAPGSPNAANEEFNDGGVIGTLTRVSHGTPKGTWAEVRGGLEWTQTATGATDLDVFAVPLTLAIGDYFSIALQTNVEWNNSKIGPFVGFSNGTTFGTSDAVGAWATPSGPFIFLLNNWTDMNSRATDGTVVQHTMGWGVRWGMRIKYEAANTWGIYSRTAGGDWRTIQITYAMTLTPTHAVFGVAMNGTPVFTAGQPQVVRLECFRVND